MAEVKTDSFDYAPEGHRISSLNEREQARATDHRKDIRRNSCSVKFRINDVTLILST